ncbi:MAG TPA: NAD(+)/NADH kinase [Ktedonobacterales bacterium]|jgi:NAD+ kinase|nr:NAD(+)/NADH kinase [Ktedonobacterales bacterium]
MGENARPAIGDLGIIYRERRPEARTLAEALARKLRSEGRHVWVAEREEGQSIVDALPRAELVLVLGGDGTILSAARLCAPLAKPILGINFGRVGFLTELEPSEVDEKLPLYLNGDYWVDERSMLQAEIAGDGGYDRLLALNDVALVRGAEPRVIHVKVTIDGHYYNTTVADGIIVSTATGSTAYNLAAGGPILHPQVRSVVITPIAPHLAADRSLILEPNAVTTLELDEESGTAVLSADGQINHAFAAHSQVVIRANSHVTRFLRRRPPTYFYRVLSGKLRDTF